MPEPTAVKGLDFSEIVEALLPQILTAISAGPNGSFVITAAALDQILDRCDDPQHAREPLAQAVYDFILAHEASIVVPQ